MIRTGTITFSKSKITTRDYPDRNKTITTTYILSWHLPKPKMQPTTQWRLCRDDPQRRNLRFRRRSRGRGSGRGPERPSLGRTLKIKSDRSVTAISSQLTLTFAASTINNNKSEKKIQKYYKLLYQCFTMQKKIWHMHQRRHWWWRNHNPMWTIL